jgi:dipeptidyl aminopeptidase/acylaminoacyl peptidase
MRSSTLYYWLPDSKAVVLALATATTPRKQYLLDLTRAEFKEIPDLDLTPHAVSLDGSIISLVRKQNNQISVSSMALATGQVRETPVRGFFNEPGGLSGIQPISPDGQRLLLTNHERPAGRVTWVAVDGNSFKDLYASNLVVPSRLLEWTADGRAILFGQFVPGSDGRVRNEARIMRIPVDGGEPTFTGLTLKGVTPNDTINVSPDGTRIVFSGNPESVSVTDPKSAR